LYTFKARVKSSTSRIFSAVATLGAPSLNSSVPMRLSTLSGVIIAGGIALAAWAVTKRGSVSTTHAARTVKAFISCFIDSSPFLVFTACSIIAADPPLLRTSCNAGFGQLTEPS
jgi:hypothetical protein